MSMKRYRTTVFVVMMVFVSACGGSKELVIDGDLPANFPSHSHSQIAGLVNLASDTLGGFKAKANISVKSPDESLSFSSDLVHRRSDSLYMTIKPALGIEAGRALVTPDSFFVYDRIKKKLYFGDIYKAGEYLPGPVSGDDVFGSLLGLPNLSGTRYEVASDSVHYVLSDDQTATTYVIDPRIWRVVVYRKRAKDGSILEQMEYSDFDDFDGVILPRRIKYENTEDGKSASIYYRSIDLNPGEYDLEFNVSGSATLVPVE